MASRRTVLFPNGQPRSADQQEACAAFFIRQNGDISRVVDGPFRDLRQFIDRVRRIAPITSGAERPIVIFTQSNPLALVLSARRTVEGAVPEMRNATWAIFVDGEEDPFFETNARQLGRLNQGEIETTFDGPGGAAFLVVYATPPA